MTHRMASVNPYIAIMLLVAAGFLIFWRVGTTSLHTADEALYAQCGREMLDDGDYLTIHHRGEPFLQKPPLKIWFIALGYRLFGVGELGARFSSAFFALGTVVLTVLLGRALFGTAVGLLAGAILASSVQFLHEHCARTAELEPETVFLYVASILLLWYVARNDRWLWGLAVCLGLLTMVKSAAVFPLLAIVVLYLLVTRRDHTIRPSTVILAILIFLGVAIPWHVQQLVVHGESFRQMYLQYEILNRFVGGTPTGAEVSVPGFKGGPTYYPRVIFYSVFPWSLLVLPGLIWLVADAAARRGRAQILLFLWLAVYGITIVVSTAKFPWYLIPMLPCLGLTVAKFCHNLYHSERSSLVVVLAVAGIALSCLFVPSIDYDPYSRASFKWLLSEYSLTPLWKLESPLLLSLVPVLITCVVVTAVGVALVVGRPRSEFDSGRSRWLCTALVGAFLFSSFYHAALPLRGAGHRGEIAQCHDAVRAARLEPERVLLLGTIARRGFNRVEYFYVYDLAGGNADNIGARNLVKPAVSDSTVWREGTLVLSDSRLRGQLSELGGISIVREGAEIDVVYVGSQTEIENRE